MLLALAGVSSAQVATASKKDAGQKETGIEETGIEAMRIRLSPERTRLVFDLTSPVEHRVFRLSAPDRLVIDFKNIVFKAELNKLNLQQTPIGQIRLGRRAKQELRVVIDLTEKVRPSSFRLQPTRPYGHRLVIDLYPLTEKPGEAPQPPERETRAGADVIIAIDAGHGGEDPGAVGEGKLYEKNVVLAISKQLASLFDRETGYTAMLIRRGDYSITLRKRIETAFDYRADFFLSIHADAFRTSRASGASVYAYSLGKSTSEAARWHADKENRVDLIGGSGLISLDDKTPVLKNVLLDLSMDANLPRSMGLASAVLRALGRVTRLHKKQVEQARFVVLKSPDIPSILIETGYISNPGEAKKLALKSHQQKLSSAIFIGVKQYVAAHPIEGTLLASINQEGLLIYTIEPGDTLSEIAFRYRVSTRKIKALNGLRSDTIQAGQKLKIPPG